jgi:hypothetical protein
MNLPKHAISIELPIQWCVSFLPLASRKVLIAELSVLKNTDGTVSAADE